MGRPVPRSEHILAILGFFRAGDGQILLAEPGFEDVLKVALRITLQVGLVLETIGDSPELARDDIDMLRDDIRSGLEFFEQIESVALGLSQMHQVQWIWPAARSWHEFRMAYSWDLTVLGATSTSLQGRYAAMVRLIRLQLVLWGMTFGLGTSGYVS